jgi:hypothetical protein
MRYSILAVALVTSALACASNQGMQGRGGPSSYGHDVINFDELARTSDNASNLYQALERTRPQFLRPRASGRVPRGAASQIDVFVNGGYAGDGTVLLSLHPSHVASVRFERRSQAFVKHGAWLRGENVLYVTLLR